MAISTCCGCETDMDEISICPECLEHCDWEEEDEEEDEVLGDERPVHPDLEEQDQRKEGLGGGDGRKHTRASRGNCRRAHARLKVLCHGRQARDVE